MEKVIVAFQSEKSCRHVRGILERSGLAECVVCRSADQVRRTAGSLRIGLVVCGCKFADGPAALLLEDLPPSCAVLMVAAQGLLDLCQNDGVFKLSTPVSQADLLAAVRMLLRAGRRQQACTAPRRPSGEELSLIRQAKALLMDRHGMTEEQAHRFLQKKSMDGGSRLAQTAQMVLENG